MSYTAPDMSDRLIQLLTDKGYRVHSGGDDSCPDLDGDGYWFTWAVDGMASCESGETCDTELEAWGSAMEHFFVNASIPLHLGPVAEALDALPVERLRSDYLALLGAFNALTSATAGHR
jgi:hypothetical protein